MKLYKFIHCQYDGNQLHNGYILREFYNTKDLARELIDHGDITGLELYNDWNSQTGQLKKVRVASTVEKMISKIEGIEYIYIAIPQEDNKVKWECYSVIELKKAKKYVPYLIDLDKLIENEAYERLKESYKEELENYKEHLSIF